MEGNDPGVEIQIADCRWLFCNSIYIISIPHVMMGNFPIPTARANLEIKMHTMRIEKRHLIYIGVIFKVQRFSILEAYFYLFLILFWGRNGWFGWNIDTNLSSLFSVVAVKQTEPLSGVK